MVVLFLGAPGSGKGTQSKTFSVDLNIAHLSTGDMLRKEVKKKSKLGRIAEEYMNTGKLVTDELMIDLIKHRIIEKDCENGFILDGFPRNLVQGKAVDKLLLENNLSFSKIIFLDVKKEVLIERLTGRYTNPKTGTVYHKKYNPPLRDGFCDLDGTKLIIREDDKEEKIIERLDVYEKETLPLIKYYEKNKNLSRIEASGTIDDISEKILKELYQDDKRK